MEKYRDFFPSLALGAALLLAALAAAPLFARFRLPGPAAFLAVGIAAGALGIAPTEDLSTVTLERVGAVALFFILFKGGLDTGFRAARLAARPILSLGIVGTAATAGGLAVAGRYVLGLDWSVAVLVAVALAPTDPAAVYAVLRGSDSSRSRTVLEGESGVNDPAAIALMVAVTATVASGSSSYGHAVFQFFEELAIGSAAGIAGAAILVFVVRKTRHHGDLDAVFVLLGAVLLGAVTATLHGSGFLAVYIAGLLLSDTWASRTDAGGEVPEALSATAEVVLFATLGAAFAPLVGIGDLASGLALTLITVFAVRPLVTLGCLVGSGLSPRDRTLVSWGGLKGAVPLLLAAYPALEHFTKADDVAAMVLVATAASLLVQGGTLPHFADRAAAAAGEGT